MKSVLLFVAACLALVPIKLPAATTHYVDAGGTNAVPPYTNWVTAATNIQDAVDASTDGDLVLVTNGVYAMGGRMWYDSGANRVTLTNAVTLQSVNGPAVTLIVGNQVVGTGSVLTNAARCVGMGNNAVLSGFTLTNGEAGQGNYPSGGGVANILSGASTVTNCVLVGNLSTNGAGGGAWRVRLINCTIVGNRGGNGGGAGSCTLINCIVVSNSASSGGGVYCDSYSGGWGVTNCTITGNTASSSGGGVGGTFGMMNNCIVYYNTAPSGSNYAGVKMNYCCTTPTLNGDLTSFTNAPLFINLAGGDFHLQSNSPCVNSGNNGFVTSSTDFDRNARIVGGAVDMGVYEFQGNIRYVSLSSKNPVAPFSDWSIAATNIQDAIDAAAPGDTVLVINGIYQTGGAIASVYNGYYTSSGNESNRVAVTKAITVRSISGPAKTTIIGRASNLSSDLVRCVFLTNGATLDGFTLTNGYTDYAGGGVWCGSTNAIVTNCIIAGNMSIPSLYGMGGGAIFGTLNDCVLSANHAPDGGGAYKSVLNNCLLTGNIAAGGGGGGGGASSCVLNSCTIVSNIGSVDGGGAEYSILNNCIVYYNIAGFSSLGNNYYSCTLNYCCTTPMPTNGVGNITNESVFVNLTNGDFHLQATSPCINSGNNAYLASLTDLDGNPRISGGTVDMGAYEYQTPSSIISYAWLQQYGLPTDGSADYVDSDGTGMVNWQKWIAGLNPTNPASVLAMTSVASTNTSSGITVSWQSVTNRTYYLQRASDLSVQPAFSAIQSNLVGQAGTTSYTDVSATNGVPYFCRVGVQ
jgi:hypothetical protein